MRKPIQTDSKTLFSRYFTADVFLFLLRSNTWTWSVRQILNQMLALRKIKNRHDAVFYCDSDVTFAAALKSSFVQNNDVTG